MSKVWQLWVKMKDDGWRVVGWFDTAQEARTELSNRWADSKGWYVIRVKHQPGFGDED